MRRHLWWVLGLVLVVGGLAIALSARPGPTDFGWTAFTPTRAGASWHMRWSGGSDVLVSRWQVAGCALAAVGLVVVAASVGFLLGRRRGNPRQGAVAGR